MLDVARHFFAVEDVKRYIDLLALYKLNVLHLHLSDDQGWRIEIKSWPRLAEVGGSTAVGGAARRLLHAGAVRRPRRLRRRALHHDRAGDRPAGPHQRRAGVVCRAELRRRSAAALHGHEVGFSSLCVDKEITYTFIDDVLANWPR